MRLTRLTVLCFICGFVYSLGYSQSHQIRIGCIGNSITYGSGLSDPETDCFPAQLQIMLEEGFGDTCSVQNFAVSGRTMLKNGDYPIWDEKEFASGYMYAPDILLILLGTNDSKPQNWDSCGHEFYDDYVSMIDTFSLRNPFIKFIVCYPPPAFEENWGIRDSVIVHGVIPAIDSVLDIRDAIFVDFYNPLIDSVHLFPDKIHPSIEGSAVMARIVFDKVLETDLIHQVELGNTFITSLASKEKRVPVNDSASISWTTINADSVWLDGILVDSVGNQKVQMIQSGYVTLIAKGEKSSDTMQVFVETYIQEIDRIQIDPVVAKANINDEIDLAVLYFDQYRLQMEDTVTDITWELIEGEGEFKNREKNQVTFVVGNQARAIIYAYYGELFSETRITVENFTDVSDIDENTFFRVYPNPVKGKVSATLNTGSPGNTSFKIFDTKGCVLKAGSYDFDNPGIHNVTLDVGSIPDGVYLYQLEHEGIVHSGKILKE